MISLVLDILVMVVVAIIILALAPYITYIWNFIPLVFPNAVYPYVIGAMLIAILAAIIGRK